MACIDPKPFNCHEYEKTPIQTYQAAFLGFGTISTTVATINSLIALARTGVMLASIDNEQLRALAAEIKKLVAENQWLKKITGGGETVPAVAVTDQQLTISFGPESNYALIVPAANPEVRQQLADQLTVAANTLRGAKKVTAQRLLPLFDAE
jgi:hypothetical protein